MPSPLQSVELLDQLDTAICTEWRSKLAGSGFRPELLSEAEAVAPALYDAVRLPLVHWWLEQRGGPGAALARLFAYQAPVPHGEVEAALGPSVTRALRSAGVLQERQDGALSSSFRVTPIEDLYVVSDPPDAAGDSAMGPGMTTLDLVRLLPRRPGSVLDVGCGAGTLALLAAARGASRAVGVDLNARAVTLSRFNAKLNGVAAHFEAGDLLEPVKGERFDLVLSQPPYVVRPAGISPTTYLHGGSRGDELALRFAAAIAGALAPRGLGLVLFDTAPAPQPLHARLRAMMGETPVELVTLIAPGPSADRQAIGYATLEDETLGKRYRAAVRQYREHLETLGGRAFSRALVLMQASDRPGGNFTVQLPVGGIGRLDSARLESFLGGLELAGLPEERLLTGSVGLAPGGRLVEERHAGSTGAEPKRSVRFEQGSLAVDRELSEAGMFLLSTLDQAPSVASGVERYAEACGEPPDAVRSTVVDFVREGLGRALLVPKAKPS